MKRLILCICTFFLCICTQAFATANLDINVSALDNFVTISVYLGEENTNKQVVLEVKNSNGDINFINQGYSDNEGKCVFKYYNKDDTDIYSVKISAGECGIEFTDTYLLLKLETIDDIVDEWKKKTSSADVQSITEQYLSYLPFDTTYYDMVSNKTKIYELYVDDRNAEVSNIDDVLEQLSYFTFACLNEEKKSASLVKTIVLSDVFGDYLGVNDIPVVEGTKTVFDLFEISEIEAIYSDIAQKSYTQAEEVKTAWGAALLSKYIKTESIYTNIETVIKRYKDSGYISVNFDTYNAHKNKQGVISALKSKDCSTYSKFETEFTNALSTVPQVSGNQNTPVVGGGGGSSGGPVAFIKQDTPKEEIPKEEKKFVKFDDIVGFEWASGAIYELQKKGVVSGVSETKFEPMRNITRAETIKMLVTLFGMESSSAIEIPFADLSAKHWGIEYISTAYSHGMIEGKSENYFGADDLISRNEMVVLAYRFIQKYELTYNTVVTNEFIDEVVPWAEEAANFSKKMGIIKGREDNSFDGNAPLTRAEAALILYNISAANNFNSEV